MKRELPGGFELDDDRVRVDADAVWRFLTESYWAKGRSLETVERLIAEATRVLGLYRDGETVGFCRIVSDGEQFAFLLDVYVLEEHRGHGLGTELVREAVEHPAHRDLGWHLGTLDAHDLYRKFGFREPDVERQMFRPRRPSAG